MSYWCWKHVPEGATPIPVEGSLSERLLDLLWQIRIWRGWCRILPHMPVETMEMGYMTPLGGPNVGQTEVFGPALTIWCRRCLKEISREPIPRRGGPR